MLARRLTPILNVSSIQESFAWFGGGLGLMLNGDLPLVEGWPSGPDENGCEEGGWVRPSRWPAG